MSIKNKAIIITIVCAVIAFILGPIFWPKSVDLAVPTAGQLPYFIILSMCETLIFGIGVSFLIFGYKKAKEIALVYGNKVLWSFYALDWMLVSWWPHDNLHAHIGMDLQKLLYIEYGFHLTLMISAMIIIYTLLSVSRKNISQP